MLLQSLLPQLLFSCLSFFCLNLPFNSVHICYRMLSCQMSCRYINKVNSLIWQTTLRNVLDQIIHCCFQNFIWQDDIVVLLIEITNPWRILKVSSAEGALTFTSLKRRARAAFFKMVLRYSSWVVAPITVNSPRESWFENIRKTFRTTFTSDWASAKDLVNFIKEEDNISCFFYFID